MFQKRIVTSNSPVTSVSIDGTPHHYFHSEALGKCRAILIADSENLASPHFEAPIRQSVVDWCKEVDSLCERLENRKVVIAAFYCELEIALNHLKQIPLSDEKEYETTLEHIRQLRAEIFDLEQGDL